jgi:cyanophycin synthetase
VLPFADSRRLTGPNLYFAGTGAVLATREVPDEALLASWRARILRARRALAWPEGAAFARPQAGGATLALPAPTDQLFLATEVNEWALLAALVERGASASALEADLLAAAVDDAGEQAAVDPPVLGDAPALARFARLKAREENPRLLAILAEASARGLPYLLDEETVTLGTGRGGRNYPRGGLPETIDWSVLSGIPTALVTGSNGKTTSVRLIAACLRAQGLRTAHACTDGVYLDEEPLASGDYSGPAGARRVLRERRAEAAVLEAARGGILRRGLAVNRAEVALVTNVSADHFGEYGIDDLAGLAEAKLTVASVVPAQGLVVLNADDAVLLAAAGELARRYGEKPLGWFALDADHPRLRTAREAGGATAGCAQGELRLDLAGVGHGLGRIEELPLAVGGSARYNLANLAGAALAASALGVAPATIAAVFRRFGADPADNPGRLMRYDFQGATCLVDYAHNPEGLTGLLSVARHLLPAGGRLLLALGHAGNRRDADIAALAVVAAQFRPAHVIVKENEAHLRGRPPGEIPAILERALIDAGIAREAIEHSPGEVDAVRRVLAMARPGDVLALPIHASAARAQVLKLLRG